MAEYDRSYEQDRPELKPTEQEIAEIKEQFAQFESDV